MGTFLSPLRTELVYAPADARRAQSENALLAYIDGSYNCERVQARLGWQSPDVYEHTWYTSRAHPEPVRAGWKHSGLPGNLRASPGVVETLVEPVLERPYRLVLSR